MGAGRGSNPAPSYVADGDWKPSLLEGFRVFEGLCDGFGDAGGDAEGVGDLVELDAEVERLVGLALDVPAP